MSMDDKLKKAFKSLAGRLPKWPKMLSPGGSAGKSFIVIGLILFGLVILAGYKFKPASDHGYEKPSMMMPLIIAGSIVLLLIGSVALALKIRSSSVPAPKEEAPEPKKKEGWWETFTKNHPSWLDLPSSAAIIALCLFFIQWVMASAQWQPWYVLRDSDAFWALNFALLFSAVAIRFSKEKVAKIFAQAVLATLIGICVYVYLYPQVKVRADTWRVFEVRKNVTLDTQPGIPFVLRINDDPKEYASGPNGEQISLPSQPRVNKLWIKPKADMKVTVIRRN